MTSADVADVFVTTQYQSSHSGVTHVNLNQRFRDLEVFGGQVTVNVADDGSVIFAGGSLVRGLSVSASGTAGLEPTGAVEAAADALDLGQPTDLTVISQSSGPARETVVSGGGISDAPIPLRLGWQPTGSGLRMAWRLVIDAPRPTACGRPQWMPRTAGCSSRRLDARTLTDLASRLKRPRATAGARGALGPARSAMVTPNPVNDGSSYRVLEFDRARTTARGRS